MVQCISYYRPIWEDLDQFLDITVWKAKGKDNQYFPSKICKTDFVKLDNMASEKPHETK